MIALVLGEAAIFGVMGGALGLIVARMLIEALIANAPAALPRVAEIGIDPSVAAFTLVVALGTSLVVGVAPALQASRRDLRSALQDGDRGSSGGGSRVRAALVFAEIALSTVLLMAAVLLARSFQQVAGGRSRVPPVAGPDGSAVAPPRPVRRARRDRRVRQPGPAENRVSPGRSRRGGGQRRPHERLSRHHGVLSGRRHRQGCARSALSNDHR